MDGFTLYKMAEVSEESLKSFYCLGIECSANKLGIGIVSGDGSILANVRRTYSAPDGEGFLPRHAAKHHRENMASLIQEALDTAGLKLSQISQICYTKGPGLGSALHVGAVAAKTLHVLTRKPVVGVNHCVAHVEMGRFLSGYKRPVILYVSGGNSQVLYFDVQRHVYAVLGETLDIAIGNVLDRVARLLNLPNKPAPGLSIEKMAREAKGDLISLPYVVKGMDCSLSGFLTRCESLIAEASEANEGKLDGDFVRTLCFSIQEHAFAMLVEIAERAMAFTKSDELLLVGGVGCNRRLQEMADTMVRERGARLFPMDERYCIDNGAMIAYTGMCDYLHGSKEDAVESLQSILVSQRYRTDQALVRWID